VLAKEYANAVDREVSLLQRGNVTEAREFDEATVDPAFEALQPELEAATAELTASGERAGRINVAGLIGTVALSLLAVLILEQRRQRNRASRNV
jgi:hypothetical protein